MSDTRDLLAGLSRLESVEAVAVGHGDQIAGTVPEWTELVLDLEDESGVRRINLTRHDGELIIQCLYEVLHPNDNKSNPVTRLWAELDDQMDFLRADDDPEPEDRARAKALALALAMLTQPYSPEPDLDPIREKAAQRWEERNGV
jgi:hypothetical protein